MKNRLLLVLGYLVPFVILSICVECMYTSPFSYLHIINRILLIIVFAVSYFIIENKRTKREAFYWIIGCGVMVGLCIAFRTLGGNMYGKTIIHGDYRGILSVLLAVFLAVVTRAIVREKL